VETKRVGPSDLKVHFTRHPPCEGCSASFAPCVVVWIGKDHTGLDGEWASRANRGTNTLRSFGSRGGRKDLSQS